MRYRKPPLGVLPYKLFVEQNPDPSIEDLVTRYGMVVSAVRRYREAGLDPMPAWLEELGVLKDGYHRAAVQRDLRL